MKTNDLVNLFVIVYLCLQQLTTIQIVDCHRKRQHKKHLDKADLRILIEENVFDEQLFRSILNKILIPRSINSIGHEKVRQYIKNSLRDLNPKWRVEEDEFRTRTPAGNVKFRNIIATYVPEFGCLKSKSPLKRTILACHYDSLFPSLVKRSSDFYETNRFIGATDAAVSCALMLYLAHSMDEHLEELWQNNVNKRKPLSTLQLVFFDGEETLRSTRKQRRRIRLPQTGSLYGSRHLASKWDHNSKLINQQNYYKTMKTNTTNRRLSSRMIVCDSLESKMVKLRQFDDKLNDKKNAKITEVKMLTAQDYNTIDGIELLILFDLIGGSANRFYNTNLNTSHYFQQLIQIEKSILELNGKQNKSPNKMFFQQHPSFMVSLVQDDHLPFIIRNVPVLHLIPHPFPRTWHSLDDNYQNLNFQSIGRLATIIQMFLVDLFQIF